jgi:hypothetical protein
MPDAIFFFLSFSQVFLCRKCSKEEEILGTLEETNLGFFFFFWEGSVIYKKKKKNLWRENKTKSVFLI